MKVYLSPEVSLRMTYYIEEIDYEISGLGIVEKLENGDLYVPEIFLLKQKVSSANTRLDPQSLAAFWDEKLQEENFPVDSVKLWWHSHVNMECFWSGTDQKTIEGLDTEQSEENWYLSIVGNKKGIRRARVDTWQPFRCTFDELDVIVGLDFDMLDNVRKEIEEKVTIREVKSNGNWHSQIKNGQNYQSGPFQEDDYKPTRSGIYVPEKESLSKVVTQALKAGVNKIL